MSEAKWVKALKRAGACREAVEWAGQYPTLQAAWDACERGDWMLWWVGLSKRASAAAAGAARAARAATEAAWASWAAARAARAAGAAWAAEAAAERAAERAAARAAEAAAFRQCADIVRRHYPLAPTFQGGIPEAKRGV